MEQTLVALRRQLLLFAKGMAMGAADVVPGVSGGTVAFISGIYEELIDSLKALEPTSLRVLVREGPRAFWRRVNGTFLVVLFAGILTSVLSLAQLVSRLLEAYPLLLWSFFFGLILASVIHVARRQRVWGVVQLACLAAGILGALAAGLSPAAAMSVTPVTIFLAGMLAICAMILPGISGAFILLLLGMYGVIIEALAAVDLAVLALFGAGAVVGLTGFSHLLSWLLHHYRAATLALLIGFLAGSLALVWPWKTSPAEGGGPRLLTPNGYGELYGDPLTALCIGLMLAGLVTVLGLEYLGSVRAWNRRRRE